MSLNAYLRGGAGRAARASAAACLALALGGLGPAALADTALADTALADTALADTALADTELAEAPPAEAPLYVPYGDAVLELGESGPRRAGSWPGLARARDSFAYPGGFVAFERESGTIYRARGASLAALGRIDAAEVFLTRSRALARSADLEPGKGFAFALYDLDGAPRKRAELYLDCFPSDCAYASGRWYLSGADRADASTRLYEIDPETGKSAVIATIPKDRDFGRVVAAGTRLIFYASPAMPRTEAREVLRFTLRPEREGGGVSSGPERVRPGFPGSCFYGSGFALGGLAWLPVASGRGNSTRIAMMAFDPAAAAPAPLGEAALDTGLYAPIGESRGRFYAFGFLYLRDRSAMSVLSIGPGGARSWKLP